MSETCCTQLTENIEYKKSPKIRHLGTIAPLCWAISSQLKHIWTIGKKLVQQQCLPHLSLQYSWTQWKWNTHVDKICAKASTRLYFLKQLKRAGLAADQLRHFYLSAIRPILEYCSVVWHHGLTKTQV